MINSEKKMEEHEQEIKFREAYDRVSFYKDLLAHDINNILQNISSSCELISIYSDNHSKSEKINELSEIIKEQITRGEKLISNVRKLTQLERPEFELGPVDTHEILKEAIEYILNRFRRREIQIKLEISDQNHIVLANEFLIDVFENILINAVKYTTNQVVEILIKVSKQEFNRSKYVKIEFMDNGIGIPHKKRKIIFQIGNMLIKSGKGMGLGLSLAKKIIESYKGKIWVENRIKGDTSRGSNFSLLIPVAI
ncbi:MAG: sensor histidine kinase [Promethearchaeota archaeon]